MISVDDLNALVTSSIWRAEQLGDLDIKTADLAWAEVSALEEQLAVVLAVGDAEGRIARRGAVAAALKARDFMRARGLVDAYCGEDGAPRRLCAELKKMLTLDAAKLAEEFPFAAKHYKPDYLQCLAQKLVEAGPFGLAAA
jgi:hypothetical protein